MISAFRTFFSILIIPGALITLLYSCNKDKEGFSTTESGLKYKFIHSGSGPKPFLGDVMIMDIMYKTPNDSILFNSATRSDSFTVVLVEPTFHGGVEEGFAMMSAGDSALFKTSADSLFKKTFQTELPAYLQPGNEITFSVRLRKIISKNTRDSLANALDIELRRKEFEKIDSFLRHNNMDVMPTENGAYMIINKPGIGDYPGRGDTVYVEFTGKLLDGSVFEESVNKDVPFRFVMGNNMVIQGWEECMPLLNKGAEARMVIPSDLGYGAKEYGKLPGYSTLVFDVKIIDVRQGNHKVSN